MSKEVKLSLLIKNLPDDCVTEIMDRQIVDSRQKESADRTILSGEKT
jgi:hypothetical protein